MFKFVSFIGVFIFSMGAMANLDCSPVTNTPSPTHVQLEIIAQPAPTVGNGKILAFVSKDNKPLARYEVKHVINPNGFVDVQTNGKAFRFLNNNKNMNNWGRLMAWSQTDQYFIVSPNMVCEGGAL